jgi:hypothetical protein
MNVWMSMMPYNFPILPKKSQPICFPDNFPHVHWTDVKESWKECVRELDRMLDDINVSGRNDPSDGEEVSFQIHLCLRSSNAYFNYILQENFGSINFLPVRCCPPLFATSHYNQPQFFLILKAFSSTMNNVVFFGI